MDKTWYFKGNTVSQCTCYVLILILYQVNALHLSFPLMYRNSLMKFRAPILKPKNCFVLSLPRIGILSTPNLFRMIDGTVSTPFRMRPISFQVPISDWRSFNRCTAFAEISLNAVRCFNCGLHSLRYGQFLHCSRSNEARICPFCFI